MGAAFTIIGLLIFFGILIFAWIDITSMKTPSRLGYFPGGYSSTGPDAGTIVVVVV